MNVMNFQSQKPYSSKHKRKRLSEDQVRLLEASFGYNKKLEPERKLQLAREVGIPPRQVAIWYQNKRARWKNQSLELDYNTLQVRLESALAEKRQFQKEVERLRVEVLALKQAQGQAQGHFSSSLSSCGDEAGSSSLHDDVNCSWVNGEEIRKAFSMMKDIAIDLEKANQSQKAKELEDAVIQLLEASEDCMHMSSAVQAIGNGYEPGEQPTNFSKLFEDEITKSKASSSSVPQNHTLLRQFRETIWNVLHAGQPMPGEEQEDIVMTSTQCNILNNACPEAEGLLLNSQIQFAGCPKSLLAERVVCDPLLPIEIAELQSMSKHTTMTEVIEDFTELDGEEDGENQSICRNLLMV
ncbi:hypothetical protein RJ639_039600 [Escallonia herrerae]|uniref:Homeobox-leucine zipper protein n=1 Tax=Escallonia herrerae TaxID=1293975 RepID=A0AA88WMF5_9ASTE|nr:hypothetical protein RJ639_039600 [Escallonia herrerae]